jgi:hypothetical protein
LKVSDEVLRRIRDGMKIKPTGIFRASITSAQLCVRNYCTHRQEHGISHARAIEVAAKAAALGKKKAGFVVARYLKTGEIVEVRGLSCH